MCADGAGETTRLFEALSHRYRRVVLYYLREHETASLATVTDLVTGWFEAGPGSDEPVDYGDVRLSLHHVHLPALDAAGRVAYDPTSRTVALTALSALDEAALDEAVEADTFGRPLDFGELLAAAEGDAANGGADASPAGGAEESDGS